MGSGSEWRSSGVSWYTPGKRSPSISTRRQAGNSDLSGRLGYTTRHTTKWGDGRWELDIERGSGRHESKSKDDLTRASIATLSPSGPHLIGAILPGEEVFLGCWRLAAEERVAWWGMGRRGWWFTPRGYLGVVAPALVADLVPSGARRSMDEPLGRRPPSSFVHFAQESPHNGGDN